MLSPEALGKHPSWSLPASGSSQKSLALLDLYPHHPSLCLHPHVAFFLLSVLCVYSSVLRRTPLLDLGSTLIQYDLILIITSARTLFPNKVTS